METIRQKVSYIRGLADGLDIKDSTKEEKVLKVIIDVLEDIADAIEDLDSAQVELDEYVEAIDEDLADVEEEIYGEEAEDGDDGFVEVECPNCHETVYLDEDLYDDEDEEIICPNCHEPIHIECECEDCTECEDEK
jgi:signal transduction histidine kinase